MRIILGSAGSRGDVIPVLEIASTLQRRGHEVEVFTPRRFEWAATERRLRVHLFATDSDRLMQSLDHGLRSTKQTFDWVRQAIVDQFEVMLPAVEGADALVTMVNELGAPTVAAHHRVPHFRLCCVPSLVGDQPPAVTPFQRMPVPVNRLLWQGVELGTRLMFSRVLDDKRRELGLPPIGRFSDYAAGSCLSLLAVDPVLVPPGRGWRHRYEYVGYPFGGDDGPLSEELEAFLEAGPPPVYFGFGSVHLADPDAVTATIVGAVRKVGCRAIVDSGWTGLGRGTRLPADVLVIGGAPHKELFPRVAAVVHHGGSGTTHNAARAGVPQLVAPQILDQYFWGERIYQLGLGPRPLPAARWTKARLAARLGELLGPLPARQALAVASLVRRDGVEAVVRVIERELGVPSDRQGDHPARSSAAGSAGAA